MPQADRGLHAPERHVRVPSRRSAALSPGGFRERLTRSSVLPSGPEAESPAHPARRPTAATPGTSRILMVISGRSPTTRASPWRTTALWPFRTSARA